MIASSQIANTVIFAFITDIVLSLRVLIMNRKGNKYC